MILLRDGRLVYQQGAQQAGDAPGKASIGHGFGQQGGSPALLWREVITARGKQITARVPPTTEQFQIKAWGVCMSMGQMCKRT